MFLEVETFNQCCGAATISGFGEPDFYGNKERTKNWVKEAKKKLKELDTGMDEEYGFSTIILNGHQYKYLGKIIQELGWKKIAQSLNPNESNETTIVLFLKKYNTTRKMLTGREFDD